MKKAISILLSIIFFCQLTVISFANDNSKFTIYEKNELKKIDISLLKNNDIIKLKETGNLDSSIQAIKTRKSNYINNSYNEIISVLKSWNISPSETVNDIMIKAQVFLNENHTGIKINSDEFKSLTHQLLSQNNLELYKKSNTKQIDPKFYPLYLYMCIYNEYILEPIEQNGTYSVPYNKTNLKNLTINEIVQKDCEKNFIDSEIPIILKEQLKLNNISRTHFPKLNGNAIKNYAITYGIHPNTSDYTTFSSDCTNFVSQALFAGGLVMVSYVGEHAHNGLIQADNRWFYLKNNTPSGYSASTSWVRVVELYNYLSPHYAIFETTNGNTMSPYLNIGFVLQGKHLIGRYSHSVIITKIYNGIEYAAHSNNTTNEAISLFYNSFHKYRVIQTY